MGVGVLLQLVLLSVRSAGLNLLWSCSGRGNEHQSESHTFLSNLRGLDPFLAFADSTYCLTFPLVVKAPQSYEHPNSCCQWVRSRTFLTRPNPRSQSRPSPTTLSPTCTVFRSPRMLQAPRADLWTRRPPIVQHSSQTNTFVPSSL